MIKHCLEPTCETLVEGSKSRCTFHEREVARSASLKGRQRRGRGWAGISRTLRQRWRDGGFGCVMAWEGNCKGRIQADHMSISGVYQPLCAYHNNRKGKP